MRILAGVIGQSIFIWHVLCGVVLCAARLEQWPDSIAYNRTLDWARFFFMGRGFTIQDGHDISVDQSGNKRHDPLWLKITAPGRFARISKGPDWNNAQISFGGNERLLRSPYRAYRKRPLVGIDYKYVAQIPERSRQLPCWRKTTTEILNAHPSHWRSRVHREALVPAAE